MNILVTGANGQLGRELALIVARGASSGSHNNEHSGCGEVETGLSTAISGDHYIFTDISGNSGSSSLEISSTSGSREGRSAPQGVAHSSERLYLDVTDGESVGRFIEEHDVECVVNCAAYTDVERAEDEPEMASLLNVTAVENLASAVRRRGGVLIHISTDYIFDGEGRNEPYLEDSTPNPLSVYGETKLKGERALIASGCRYIILRTSWLYSEFGRNFVKRMLELTATKESISVVMDQVGSPTYASDLAEVIFKIIEERRFVGGEGVYNYTNNGECSWYEFAVAIAEMAEHKGCRILPCGSAEYPQKAVRPAYSVLDKRKIVDRFGVKLSDWRDSLKCCLANLTREI